MVRALASATIKSARNSNGKCAGLKSLRENYAGPISAPTTNQRVPHISLVFREMWDATAADLHSSALQGLPIEVCGAPHLAKNQRDVGHPSIRGGMRSFDRRVLTHRK